MVFRNSCRAPGSHPLGIQVKTWLPGCVAATRGRRPGLTDRQTDRHGAARPGGLGRAREGRGQGWWGGGAGSRRRRARGLSGLPGGGALLAATPSPLRIRGAIGGGQGAGKWRCPPLPPVLISAGRMSAAGRGVPALRAAAVAGDNVFAGDKRGAAARRLCTQTPLSCANTCARLAPPRAQDPRGGGAACDRGRPRRRPGVGAGLGKGAEWADLPAGSACGLQGPEGESWCAPCGRVGGGCRWASEGVFL